MVLVAPRPALRTLPTSRLWLYRLAALVLGPVLFFATVEGACLLLGIGDPTEFILRPSVDGERRIMSNPSFAKKYFGPLLNRSSVPFNLALRKSPNTYRIFVLGGSAARGFPQPAFSLGRQLEVLLTERYPETRFEVINTAITAVNSHVVREVARDCARLEPDAFVVYLGNNEVVGPFGPGTVFTPLLRRQCFIRASLAARSARTGQLLTQVSQQFAGSLKQSPHQWRGMEMFLENVVPHDDSRLRTMYEHFESNLEAICEAGESAGAKVFLCTVGTNEVDCAPFGSSLSESLSESDRSSWHEHFQQGQEHRVAEQWQAAIDEFDAAMRLDDEHAELNYQLGLCHLQVGHKDSAQKLLSRARDLDTLRFRADRRINEIIREVAGRRAHRISVETEVALRRASTTGILDREAFYEHVHLRFTGNYRVAHELLRAIDRLAEGPAAVEGSKRDGTILSEAELRSRLAFSVLEQHEALETILSVASRPPFTSEFHREEAARLTSELRDLAKHLNGKPRGEALALHEAACDKSSHWMLHDRYAAVLFRYARDLKQAETHWRQAVAAVPFSHEINHHLAIVLAAQQRPQEAVPYFRRALSSNPHSPSVRLNYARVLSSLGDYAEAERHLGKAARLRPNSAPVLLVQAELLRRRGRFEGSIATYQRALELAPEDAAVHVALGELFETTRQTISARKSYRQAIAIATQHGQIQLARHAQVRIEKLSRDS